MRRCSAGGLRCNESCRAVVQDNGVLSFFQEKRHASTVLSHTPFAVRAVGPAVGQAVGGATLLSVHYIPRTTYFLYFVNTISVRYGWPWAVRSRCAVFSSTIRMGDSCRDGRQMCLC